MFGYYAKNQYNKYSDIDIALISPNFTGNPFYDNEKIRDAKFAASYNIEAHTFTVDEFNINNPFVREIIKTGISIN